MAADLTRSMHEYLERAEAFLDRYMDSREPEDLHQMRVSLKKVRAPAWLLAQVNPSAKFRRHLEQWIRLFRQSGTVRDLEVQYKMLSGADAPPALLNTWNSRMDRARLKFRRYVAKNRNVLSRALEKIGRDKLPIHRDAAMQQLQAEWKSLITAMTPDEPHDWHECRKRIKRFMYLNSFLPAVINIPPLVPVSVLPAMDALQNIIGKWHDLEVILDELDGKAPGSKETAFISGTLRPAHSCLAGDVSKQMRAFLALAGHLRL